MSLAAIVLALYQKLYYAVFFYGFAWICIGHLQFIGIGYFKMYPNLLSVIQVYKRLCEK